MRKNKHKVIDEFFYFLFKKNSFQIEILRGIKVFIYDAWTTIFQKAIKKEKNQAFLLFFIHKSI